MSLALRAVASHSNLPGARYYLSIMQKKERLRDGGAAPERMGAASGAAWCVRGGLRGLGIRSVAGGFEEVRDTAEVPDDCLSLRVLRVFA